MGLSNWFGSKEKSSLIETERRKKAEKERRDVERRLRLLQTEVEVISRRVQRGK
jgi:hypothetical protein